MDGAKRKVLARPRGEENAYSATPASALRAAGNPSRDGTSASPRARAPVPAAAMRLDKSHCPARGAEGVRPRQPTALRRGEIDVPGAEAA
jgi:hypothetical protein